MNTKSKYIIIALLLLIGLLYGCYLLIIKLWPVISAANPTVIAGIIGGSVTITVSIFSVFVGRYLERKKNIETEIRNKKIPIYEEFIGSVVDWLLRKSHEKTDEELLMIIKEFAQKIIIWGNQSVIRKWVEFRTNASSQDPNKKHVMEIFEELLLEIRKDIGQNNSKLLDGDLMSVFVNDYLEVIGKQRNNSLQQSSITKTNTAI